MEKKEKVKDLWQRTNGKCQICGAELVWEQRDCTRYVGGWTVLRPEENGEDKEIICCCVCEKIRNR